MRKMIWVQSIHDELWSCSECAWAFAPSSPPRGNTLSEIMENFERQRDKQFASHVCAEHPKPKGQQPSAKCATEKPQVSRKSGG